MSEPNDENQQDLPYGYDLSYVTRLKLYFYTHKRQGCVLILLSFTLIPILIFVWTCIRLDIHRPILLLLTDVMFILTNLVLLMIGIKFSQWYRSYVPNSVYVPEKYRHRFFKRNLPLGSFDWFAFIIAVLLGILTTILGINSFREATTQHSFWILLRQRPPSLMTIDMLEQVLMSVMSLSLVFALLPFPKRFAKTHSWIAATKLASGLLIGYACISAYGILVLWAFSTGLKSYSWELHLGILGCLIFVGLPILAIESTVRAVIRRRSRRRREVTLRESDE